MGVAELGSERRTLLLHLRVLIGEAAGEHCSDKAHLREKHELVSFETSFKQFDKLHSDFLG